MNIEDIKINEYGVIKNKEIKLKKGINIIHGNNESGKSTLLSYINNSLYGNVQDDFVLNNAYKVGYELINHTQSESKLFTDLSEQDARFSPLLEFRLPQSIMSGTPEVLKLFLKGVFNTSIIDVNS